MKLEITVAGGAERHELRAMQAHSFRTLGRPFYAGNVIEAFISGIGTMDDTLLDEGGYFAVRSSGRIVGCGGWSRRMPGYASHIADGARPRSTPTATVRSVFVDPEFARRGIGGRLMRMIEAKMAAAGFARASLTATLPGVPLYRHLGYGGLDPVTLLLPNELKLDALPMEKPLSDTNPVAERAA